MIWGQDRAEVKSMIDLVLVKKEGYAALCSGCEDGEGNGMRPLRPPRCTG